MNYQITFEPDGTYHVDLFDDDLPKGYAKFDLHGQIVDYQIPIKGSCVQDLVQAAQEIAIKVVARKTQAAHLSPRLSDHENS